MNGIMNLKSLKHLTFRCAVNRIGAKAGKTFQKLLSQLTELRYLELHLQDNSMYDEGL